VPVCTREEWSMTVNRVHCWEDLIPHVSRFFSPCSLPWRLLRLSLVLITNQNRKTILREVGWSVSCVIYWVVPFFCFPVQHLMFIWGPNVGGPEIDDWRRSFSPPMFQLNYGESLLHRRNPEVPFFNIVLRHSVSWGDSRKKTFRHWMSFSVEEEQCLYIDCVFFLADCREGSFARAIS